MIDRDIYPVTIFCDRYGGLYSGGKWVALHCDPLKVPEDAYGSDIPCSAFYSIHGHCGIGNTPNEAYEDLVIKIREKINNGDILHLFQ